MKWHLTKWAERAAIRCPGSAAPAMNKKAHTQKVLEFKKFGFLHGRQFGARGALQIQII